MNYIATTIKEHIQYESEIKGEIKGKIKLLEGLRAEGVLSKELFEKKVEPLRRELKDLLGEKVRRDQMNSDLLAAAH